jgi:hypothetical protein
MIPPTDLSSFLKTLSLPMLEIRRIVDAGSCDGSRMIGAISDLPVLDRPDVDIHCVDICLSSLEAGRRWWAARHDAAARGRLWPSKRHPRFSVNFVHANIAELPSDLCVERADLWIDWMTLHGLPGEALPAYRQQLERCRPRFVILKCFTREHGTLRALPQAVPGVQKNLLSDLDIAQFLGQTYKLFGSPTDWPERLTDSGHLDGPEAAKRAYCFQRVAV